MAIPLTPTETQLLRDRNNPEYAQAKGHNKRVRDVYPEIWAQSTITDRVLTEWIFEHKGDKCKYCSGKVKEVDHIHPLSKGGLHVLENLQMLCMDCNRSKHDMTDSEFASFREINKPKSSNYGIDHSSLKHGVLGRYRTRSLFREMWKKVNGKEPLPPVFTLKYKDTDGLLSMGRLYLEIADPTEYRFAKIVFGDHRHLVKLAGLLWFQPFLKEWRAELKAKLRADAVSRLVELSESNLAAIKTIAQEDFMYESYLDAGGSRRGRGRPKKEAVVDVLPEETMNDDAARMGLA